jgi:capsular polysaccharide biosynthesis protein
MAADVYYTSIQRPTFLGRATLIISPSSTVEPGSLVYSVDSIGRGRIVGTYAEVLGSEVVHRAVLERLGYPTGALNREVTFRSSGVADTAVVQVTAESFDPDLSARAANLAGEIGIERMRELWPVYNLTFLTPAVPPTSRNEPKPLRNYSLGLLFGMTLGTVAAWLLDAALGRRRRSARPEAAASAASAAPIVEPPMPAEARQRAVAEPGRPVAEVDPPAVLDAPAASAPVAPVEPTAIDAAPAAPEVGPAQEPIRPNYPESDDTATPPIALGDPLDRAVPATEVPSATAEAVVRAPVEQPAPHSLANGSDASDPTSGRSARPAPVEELGPSIHPRSFNDIEARLAQLTSRLKPDVGPANGSTPSAPSDRAED